MTTTPPAGLPIAFQRPLPLTARQPFCALWLVSNLAFLAVVRLPFWCLWYLPPWTRQNRKWTWRQALMVRIAQFHHTFTISLRPEQTANPKPGGLGGPKELFEAIEPAPSEVLRGILSPSQTKVEPVTRPGNWYPSRYNPAEDQTVILYFFAGAFVIGGHTPSLYAATLDKLLPAVGPNTKWLGVGYRLASTKGNHFPAQLLDALSAYRHLLSKGLSPQNIILMGDSAGAHICISLIRYLNEYPDTLPLPAAAILSSPWVDLSLDFSEAKNPKYQHDILTQDILDWGQTTFVPSGVPLTDAYISPAHHPFQLNIPVYIEMDTNEVLYESAFRFVERMKMIQANDIHLHITEDGTHVMLMYGGLLGFPDRVQNSAEDIRSFLRSRKIIGAGSSRALGLRAAGWN